MSVRRETLQIARLAPTLLGDSADLVAQFVSRRLNADGSLWSGLGKVGADLTAEQAYGAARATAAQSHSRPSGRGPSGCDRPSIRPSV